MDPGEVPPELKGLTQLEEELISRINPIVRVTTVKKQQYKYSGNVINFPQHVEEIAKVLPRKISDLKSILAVRAKTKNSEKNDTASSNEEIFTEFYVRAAKVRAALEWLKKNNKYHDIEISEENLSLLPENNNMF
jgi:DNA-directed RNA polymerase subunit F